MPYSLSDFEEEKEFVSDDPRTQVIKEMTDDEEIDATLRLIEEKYDGPQEDTPSGRTEPRTPDSEGKDTSAKPEDKTQTGDEGKAPAEGKPAEGGDFALTEEIINKQPEENRAILLKYKDKGKAEIAKAAANAIAAKNPYLKDDQKMIDALAEKLMIRNSDELLTELVGSQKEIGKTEQPAEPKARTAEPIKIELPKIPEEDPQIKKVLEQELVKRLRKKYSTLPDDFESDEYKEWERDLQDTGLQRSNQFLEDLKTERAAVYSQMQVTAYAEQNLKNLYRDDNEFAKLAQRVTPENLAQLKNLNDNYVQINNSILEGEVKQISQELEKYGLSLEDLGLDLKLEKDDTGAYFNKELYPLIFSDPEQKSIDPNIIRIVGRVPVLNKGRLAEKFILRNNPKLLNAIADKKSKQDVQKVQKLKDENLINISSGPSGASKQIKPEEVKQIYDESALDKIMSTIESKYN